MRVTINEYFTALQFADYVERHKGLSKEQKTTVLLEIVNTLPRGPVAQQFKETSEIVCDYIGGKARGVDASKAD